MLLLLASVLQFTERLRYVLNKGVDLEQNKEIAQICGIKLTRHYNIIFVVVIVAYQEATGRVDRKADLNVGGHER